MNRYFGLHTLEGEWHALLPRYLLLAGRVKDKRILDIGCGTGIGSSLLLELGAQMVDAIDHRPAVLELARMKHAKQGLDFHVMFWEELDFPDDTFDIALCLDPSSPVTDPSLIQEVRRVLKSDGEYVCAIERKQLDGLEVLLPRYGYTDSAESIEVNSSTERVPQLGELAAHFENALCVVQRPIISFLFDLEPLEAGDPESLRKVQDSGEKGLWIQQESEVSEDDDAPSDRGRWLSVDETLGRRDPEKASVEIWFCADSPLAPPPLREIRLPYYSLVQRLEQVVNDLQVRQVTQGRDEDVFDEVIDEPNEFAERENTSEFKVVKFEDTPTRVRSRDEFDAFGSAQNVGLDETTHAREDRPAARADAGPVDELNALYAQVRNDLQQVVREAQQALEERDHYIAHLVATIRQWESRFAAAPDEPVDEDDNTSVYAPPELVDASQVQELRERLDALERERDELLAHFEQASTAEAPGRAGEDAPNEPAPGEGGPSDAEARVEDDASEAKSSEAERAPEDDAPAEEAPASTDDAREETDEDDASVRDET